ncbi:hypothetical protein ACLKA6_003438 [Drosophila palustris]
MQLLYLCAVLLASLGHVFGYSYLMVLPTGAKSHFYVGQALAKGLVAAGHEVTLVSPFPQKKPIKNLLDINLPSIVPAMDVFKNKIFENAKKSLVERHPLLHAVGLMMTKKLLEESSVELLLKENRTYDAVICEVFMNEAHFGFAERFQAPLIGLATFGASSWTTELVGTPSPPSYVPHFLLPLSDHMSFYERAHNLLFTAYDLVYQKFFYLPQQEQLYRKFFPHNKQDFYEMRRNTALVLLNNHVSLSFPRPYAPNMVEVGGMHVQRQQNPLPQDIEEFIKGAKHGVIYFSMGSNVKSADFPQQKRDALIETFRSLKQRVLWKFEDRKLPGKPENVFISDWFPQDDILAHENVKLFITHGGLLSTTESIYHGKPIVGIPIFGDQHMNMARAQQSGFGITVRFDQLSSETLRNAVQRVFNDPSYTRQARAMSERFRDQHETPLERAIYWVEHVTRQKGAQYLRSSAQDLSFVEYHNLDVLAMIVGGLGFISFAIVYLLMALLKFVRLVLPTGARSHYNVGSALAKGLAAAGHQVTLVSPFALKKPIENIIDVPVPGILKAMGGDIDNLLTKSAQPIIQQIIGFYDMGVRISEAFLQDPDVQKLMQSNQTFDAVIDEVFLDESLFGLAEHFNAPLIGLGTFGAISWNTDMVGSPSPASYVPHALLKFSDHMSFVERVINLAFLTYEYLFMQFYYLPKQELVYNKYFPNNKQSFYETRSNAALVLLNQHVSLSFPRPYSPNMIKVGGMHIQRKRQPLPKDIEEFINGAKHGVIYFSMGSNLKSTNLPQEKRQALIDTFSQLKQRVLWKFEDNKLPGKPENVYISDWFPQDDILAHENVKLFITHGGLLSTTESIYHGTPFVGIPIFGDQFLNMARAEQNGYGKTVNYEDLTSERLLAAIKKITEDPQALQLIRDMSSRYRDQPQLPLERAVFWVEHVSRHKGAKYLRSASQDLSFVQYHNLDAILVLYGGILFVIFCLLLLIRRAWRALQDFFMGLKASKPKVKRN